tara:strand:- start:404 stop:748 length:345 start_codon:yes stop_codon:yes gene_type:complete
VATDRATGLAGQAYCGSGLRFRPHTVYNSGDDKDHWNITSIMAMGAGITGNRLIGETNENFEALKLNRDTLTLDDNGINVTPQHVHRSLRDFLGVQDDLDNLFPINVEKLDLFG